MRYPHMMTTIINVLLDLDGSKSMAPYKHFADKEVLVVQKAGDVILLHVGGAILNATVIGVLSIDIQGNVREIKISATYSQQAPASTDPLPESPPQAHLRIAEP